MGCMNSELLPQLPTPKSLIILSVLSNSNGDFDLVFQKFRGSGRPRLLSCGQLLQCLDDKARYACENWKGLYNCMVENRLDWKIPSYANFLKNLKSLLFFLVELINLTLYINRLEFFSRSDKVAFIDATTLPVCKVIRSSRHKTMYQFAQYSKGTMGWYYGLKLHAVCDYSNNRALYISITSAKLDDRQVLKTIMESDNLFRNTGTMFVADKGYQAKWLEELAYETGNYLLTGKKKSKNMKILASQFDIWLLRNRAKIETFFSNLKLNNFITSTRSRSPLGYLFTYINSICSLVKRKD
jgi:Transposase DDE domain